MHHREESSRVASLASPSLCGLDRPGRRAGREHPFLSPSVGYVSGSLHFQMLMHNGEVRQLSPRAGSSEIKPAPRAAPHLV